MALIVGSILVAIFVVPPPWGPVLVGCAIVWEIAEKAFWFRSTKRIPIAVGREAMIGLPVIVISPCQPEGRVQLRGERWKARCTAGAGVGDALVIEAVEHITLVVGKPGSELAQNMCAAATAVWRAPVGVNQIAPATDAPTTASTPPQPEPFASSSLRGRPEITQPALRGHVSG